VCTNEQTQFIFSSYKRILKPKRASGYVRVGERDEEESSFEMLRCMLMIQIFSAHTLHIHDQMRLLEAELC